MPRDPLLIPLTEATDEGSRQEEMERVLIEHARPIIEAVIARHTRSEGILPRQEADDILATVSLRLLRRLQEDEGTEGIRDLEDYVATLTYNVIHDYFRQRFPERSRLKNRIRELLREDERFALWSAGGELAAGLRQWRGRTDLRALSIDRGSATGTMLDAERPGAALEAVLLRAGGPVALEALVRAAAGLWDVTNRKVEVADELLLDAAPTQAAKYETRQFLDVLWREIVVLPRNQRAALLLNLRDAEGVNAIALFIVTGVARFEEIADAIGVTVDELAALWEGLPVDDRTIAARIGVTRQQVINLRRAARERLARRTNMIHAGARRG